MTLFPVVSSIRCFFYYKPKSNLCTVLTTQNTTENNCIISHAQNTNALQLSLFLTGTHWLLITSKGQSALPSAHHCQVQLQTPRLLTVLDTFDAGIYGYQEQAHGGLLTGCNPASERFT